ncbi:MAG: hypothetical protein H6706_25795 [Myxococcales bacterium]|nr:hypothetical protein [Myxococcales bacterium]
MALVLAGCAQGDLGVGDGGAAVQGAPLGCGQAGSEAGACEGQWLVFCFEGEERRLDCSLVDSTCGFDAAQGVNRCLPPGGGPGGPVSEPLPPVDPPPDDPPIDPPPDDPPGDPPLGGVCAGVDSGRRCEGDTVVICRAGEAGGRTNCAANGLICGALPDGSDGCLDPNGQPPDPQRPEELPQEGICGGVAIGSRCERDFVVSCRDGREESRFDCGGQGQACDQLDAQWAGCTGGNNNPPPPNNDPEPAGCGDVPFWGQCTGDVYEVCNLFEDEVITIDCRFLAARCGTNADGLIGCIWE